MNASATKPAARILGKMKVTKRQLRRIITEEKTRLLREQRGSATVPITQQNYDQFVEDIVSGLGWIDSDDVKRQWETMGYPELSSAAVNYLVELLAADPFLADWAGLDMDDDIGPY